MYNRITIMGRICHTLELKVTPSGVSVCSFSVAVDRRFQAKGEEKQTDFFNVVTWRQTAEFVTKYFAKGQSILVDGEMQSRKYTNKNGVDVTIWEVQADRVAFTGDKRQDGSTSSGYADTFKGGATEQPATQPTEVADDDYPF